jgi:hypothetical protein
MANFDTNLYLKRNKHRGVYGGKEQTVTGVLRVADGGSIETTDLIRAVPLGENVRPIRIVLSATPVSGSPALTNATFDVGVIPYQTAAYERPDGTEYPALTADPDALSAAAAIDTDEMFTDIEIPRPVADSVAAYAPYVVTLTPAGAGAFSVSGGDIDLAVTVTFLGEQNANGLVYTTYVDQKVSND